MFERPDTGERVYCAHIQTLDSEDSDAAELCELARAAGAEVVGESWINLTRPSARTLIASGTVATLGNAVAACDAEVLLVSAELSPAQERNLERELEMRVLTRTELILDIFAQRARSHEGQLQVELAQLRHWSTRLVRGWTHLDRQKGGIGMRGAGEKQIELDQRIIGHRIRVVESKLQRVRTRRAQSRRARVRRETPTVALVGYTNAGKSTLFNRLTDAHVYAQDQLFATLDPTMRRVKVPQVGEVVLADTVGFVRQLPHQLVDAFKATLEEVSEATVLVHVVDASSASRQVQRVGVYSVLRELGAHDVPVIEVFNKVDRCDGTAPHIDRIQLRDLREDFGDDPREVTRVWASAATGAGMDLLLRAISDQLTGGIIRYELGLSPSAGKLRAELYERDAVVAEAPAEDGGFVLQVRLSQDQVNRLASAAGVRSLRVFKPAPVSAPAMANGEHQGALPR